MVAHTNNGHKSRGRLNKRYPDVPKVMDPVDAVFTLYGKDLVERNNIEVRCPLHGGKSFWITLDENGHVWAYCHGGCDRDESNRAWLRWAANEGVAPETWEHDSQHRGEPRTQKPFDRTWWESLPDATPADIKKVCKEGVHWEDVQELGLKKDGRRVLYPVKHFDKFTDYKWYDKGLWKISQGGHPHVCAPFDFSEEEVWLCEGESDGWAALGAEGVDVAWTTGGAGYVPSSEEAALFAGRRVYVVWDADAAGQAKQARVVAALRAAGADAHGVVWPAEWGGKGRKDVRDWLNEGNELRELIGDEADALGARCYDLRDLAAIPPAEPLVEDVLSLRTYNVLAGAGGANKTFFALDLALCVATGTAWKGREVVPGPVPVTFVVGEGQSGLWRRVEAWEEDNGVQVPRGMVDFVVRPNSLKGESAWLALCARVRRHGSRLVLFDTFSSLWPDADETDDAAVITRRLGDLALEADAATLLLHHTGWGETAQKRVRGASQWEHNADAVFIMTKVEGEDGLCDLWLKKVKDGEDGEHVFLRRELCADSCVLVETAPPKPEAAPKEARAASVVNVLHKLSTLGPMGSYELREACNGRNADIGRMIGVAVDKGFVSVETVGRGKKLHTITEAGIGELEAARGGLNRED